MAIVRDERHVRLRFGVPEVGGARNGGTGVESPVDPPAVPIGATVHAVVDRPTEVIGAVDERGELSDGGAAAGQVQPYVFEHAPLAPTFTAGFVQHRTLNRILVTNGLGKLTPFAAVPAFAVFAPAQDGSLVQKGRKEHFIVMPGAPSLTPALPPADKHLLRVRWKGTPVGGAENVGTGAGGPGDQTIADKQLANRRIAPGSFVLTATYGANTLTVRDNGRGRLMGVIPATPNTNSADGFIDYLEGVFTLKFFPAPDVGTPIECTYEHSTRYNPLDIHLAWDALMGQ